MAETAPQKNDYPSLASLNLRSTGQRLARLGQFVQAKYGNKFSDTVQFLAAYIPAGGVLFDVGAHHGRFAKQLARLHGGSGRVFCFEPLEYNYTLLESVTRPFRNVKIIRAALSDREGHANLFVPVKKASHRIGTVYAHLGDEAHSEFFAARSDRSVYRITIRTETLAAVVARERLERLDFMKVDVEGAESLVFKGGLASLQKHKPAIFCEICPGFPERLGLAAQDTVQQLLGLGYQMFAYDESRRSLEPRSDCRATLMDYLFLHPERSYGNPAAKPEK